MSPSRRRLAVPLLTGLLVFSACGGGDGDGPDSSDGGRSAAASKPADRDTETPKQEPSTTGEDDAQDPADQEVVESALLTLQDFPVGWEAAPGEDDGDDREGRQKIAACVGVDYEQLYDDDNTEAESPTFTSENDSEVDHRVSIAVDEADMAGAFEIASTPEFRECTAKGVAEAVEGSGDESGTDLSVGEISLNELSVGSFGDQTLAYRITVPVEADGISIEVKIEAVIVRVGRAQSNMIATSYGSGISTEELAGFTRTAVKRLEDAVTG